MTRLISTRVIPWSLLSNTANSCDGIRSSQSWAVVVVQTIDTSTASATLAARSTGPDGQPIEGAAFAANLGKHGERGGDRTHDHLIKSQMLYH